MKECVFNIFKITLLALFIPLSTLTGQNCVAPSYAEAGRLTGTTATLFWLDYNGNTQWNCALSPTPLSDPSTAAIFYTVTGDDSYMEYPVSGLTPDIDYYFYIRSVCGTNLSSSWTGGTFHTRCADKPVTYVADFSGPSLPDCWSVVDGYPTIAAADAAHPSVLSLPAYSAVALPSFNVPLNTLMVNFYIRAEDASTPLDVAVMEDVEDLMTYEGIESVTVPSANTFYGKHVQLESYTGSAKYIVLYNNSETGCYIDNLTVSLIPDCLSPVNVEAWNVTDHSAVIHWNEAGTATQWQGFLSTSPVTDFSSQTPQLLTDSSCALSTLAPNTDYYYYVRSICGNDYSGWSNIYFTTLCEPEGLPESESFSAQLPACWSMGRVNGTSDIRFVSSGDNPTCSPAGGNYMVKWESAVNSAGSQARLVSLPLSTVGTDVLNVHFMWHHDLQNANGQDDGVRVQYSLDGSTWVNSAQDLIRRYDGVHSGWTGYDVALPGAGNQSLVLVGFLFNSAHGANCYLDEVTFESGSGCLPPVNVGVSDIGGNSATLSWSDAGGATGWNVVVSETPVEDFSLVSPLPVGSSPYLLANLNPNTTYYVYVQSRCAANSTSDWVAAVPFTTSCGEILSLPFEESFDQYGTCSGAFPPCWRRYGNPGLGTYFHNGQSCTTPSATDMDAADGDKSLLVCTPSGGISYMISPAIHDNIRDMAVTFYLKKSASQNTGAFDIGVMSDAADIATFELITTVELESAGEWFFIPVSFENATANGSGYRIVFRHSGILDENYYLLDGVSIQNRPDCWSANQLAVSEVTGNSATFSWHDPNVPSAQWKLKVSDTPMSDLSQAANVFDQTVGESPLTLDYLQGGTTYYYYVQSDCGDNALGSWDNGQFSTLPCNCYVDFYLNDSWANGWEGAKIQMKHGETVFAEVGLTHGAHDTVRVYTCDAANIDYCFVSGGYDADISFTIVSSLGSTLYATSGTPVAGCFYSGVPACGVSCGTAPSNLAVAVTEEGHSLTWEAAPEALSYSVYRNNTLIADYVPRTAYMDAGAGHNDSCYTVAARCIIGESGLSDEVCIPHTDPGPDTDTIIGISVQPLTHTVSIFPNPARDRFTVSADFPLGRVSVVNLLGQEVLRKEVAGRRTEINVSELPNGIYLVRILDGSSCIVRKIIVE